MKIALSEWKTHLPCGFPSATSGGPTKINEEGKGEGEGDGEGKKRVYKEWPFEMSSKRAPSAPVKVVKLLSSSSGGWHDGIGGICSVLTSLGQGQGKGKGQTSKLTSNQAGLMKYV